MRILISEIKPTADLTLSLPLERGKKLPDYSHVEELLRALLDKGHSDAVFKLGEELCSTAPDRPRSPAMMEIPLWRLPVFWTLSCGESNQEKIQKK